MADKEKILELKNVVYSFHTYGGEVKAVRDVSFEVRKGEILGIVGESGCGKSVTAQCIMRLNPEPPGFFEGGEVLVNGKDVLKMTKKELRNDFFESDDESWSPDRRSIFGAHGCNKEGS